METPFDYFFDDRTNPRTIEALRREPLALPLEAYARRLHEDGYATHRVSCSERAEPTELLVQSLRDRQGPVDVYCFPYPAQAADLAVSMRIGPGIQLRVAGMGLPEAHRHGAVDPCETALARAAMH